jgi:Na+/alanine symporter
MNPGSVTGLAFLVIAASILIGSGGDISSIESIRVPAMVGIGIAIILVLGVALRGMLPPSRH